MKTIYLIRHSAPFIEIDNYGDHKTATWKDYNRNMILSPEGEDNARKLINIEELNNLDEVYSSDSYRAIGTAKYTAEKNNLKIKLDNRINERELGVNKICELPDNFSDDSFYNKNLKFGFGESLNEVDERFNLFLNDILSSDKNRVALFIHGILMMSFLQNNTEFEYKDRILKLVFNNEIIYSDKMKNPMIFELIYDDNNKLISIKNIEV